MKKVFLSGLIAIITSYGAGGQLFAQQTTDGFPDTPEQLEELILELDRQFWEAYNSCDVASMMSFITDDIEFYHDIGGLTEGSATMEEGIKRGLCNPTDPKLRREAISGTVAVFPIADYGALIRGEHRFFVSVAGQEEFLDGQAQFMHLWRYENGKWQMARVFSYDHRPAGEE